MQQRHGVDRLFLSIAIALLCAGFLIFTSASLGILAKDQSKFFNLLISQLGFGLILGTTAMYGFSLLKYQFWRKYAFWIFGATIILSILVFVPGIGMEHGGARRWIDLRITTIQPGELLKFGVTVYLATWFTFVRKRIQSPYFGFYPLLALLGIAGALLLGQPDTGTFLIAVAAGMAMFIAAGARWREMIIMVIMGAVLLGGVAIWKPYVRERIATLIHHDDFQGAGYQVRQSLIAVGSGGIFGKGFGQSIQKFNYLPEAQGDSIFAVAAEEFGFIGSTILILLYILFALRGLWIAAHAPDRFSGLLAVGLVILITSQSFINIGSMLAIAPLTGVPLVFVSHGGTALMVAMAEVGILLNISRYRHS
jgi:cell division protein FtsW